jgi:hypothetical protein
VRDGAQERGLDVVRASQRRRLDRLGLERVAAQGDGDERAEGGHDLRAQPLGHFRGQPTRNHQAGDLGAVAATERERGPALVAFGHPELDRRRGHRERFRDPARGGAQGGAGVRAGEELAREGGGQVGLAAASLGLELAAARELGHGADHGRNRHEGGERDPVTVIGEGELAERREMEVIEGGGTEQRREDTEEEPPVGRDEQDGDQVDDAERQDRRHRLQGIDEESGRRHRAHRHGDAQGPPRASAEPEIGGEA